MIAAFLACAVAALSQADADLLRGDHAAAAAAYARAAETASGPAERAEARYREALARLSAGAPATAARILETLVREAPPPHIPRARALLGEAYLAAGRPTEAVEAFRAYVVLHPGGDEEAWVYLGAARALLAAGRADEARAFDEEIQRRWPIFHALLHRESPPRGRARE